MPPRIIRTLKPQPPYNFDLLLAVLDRFAHPTMNHSWDGAFRRVLRDEDGIALIEVQSRGTIDDPALEVAVLTQSGEVREDALLNTVTHVLACNGNRAAFFDMARSDAKLWEVVAPTLGIPALRTQTVHEALVQTIIEQQIAWKAALRAQHWLLAWGGETLDYDGQRYHAYPPPEVLAAATLDELKPLKITHRRINLLIEIAQAIVSGTLNLEPLATIPIDEAYDTLLAIKGIGHWTAAVTLARSRGEFRFVPHNDVALQAAVNAYFYGGEGRIPGELVVKTFAPYGDYAGLAADYTLTRWVLDRYPVRGL